MTPCDEWTGAIDTSTGYGIITFTVDGKPKRVGAHRLAMMQVVGHLASSQFVCHTCDNRRCINVDHLFVGSHTDNARDMCAKGRQHQQVKTHCPQGHEYTDENTYIGTRPGGGEYRDCKECNRATALRRYYQNRDKRLAQMKAYNNRMKEQTK